jgi:ATP-binding cassette subfamily B protein
MIVGLACLIPAILAEPIDITKLAISMGGVMLTYQAFGAIQGGIQSLIQLRLTWGQVQPLFTAASQPGDTGEKSSPTVILAPTTSPQFKSAIPPSENIAAAADESTADQKDPQELPSTQIVGLLQENRLGKSPLLVARHLNFRYREYSRMILQDCSLQIFTGDRILLEGSSGGGKSTLAAVLAGLRQVETGALLLHGYDRQSLGAEAWRKRVVIAPQFHENHVFSETFSFNLLMGRNWPPSAQDMDEAAAICNELGLGALLARMPSGWQQMVGENGWQLSHGERSRVFIARALLQNADLIIMDESFGALDPENLYMALECVRRRASTLLVIAHP